VRGAPGAVTCVVNGTNNTDHLFVDTPNPSNTVGADHAFYITLTP
jgi:hypothetical protein